MIQTYNDAKAASYVSFNVHLYHLCYADPSSRSIIYYSALQRPAEYRLDVLGNFPLQSPLRQVSASESKPSSHATFYRRRV